MVVNGGRGWYELLCIVVRPGTNKVSKVRAGEDSLRMCILTSKVSKTKRNASLTS